MRTGVVLVRIIALQTILFLISAITVSGTTGTTKSKAKSIDIVVTYPVAVDETLSQIYSVTVNGQNIKVVKDGNHSYVYFAFAGTANIKITVNENVTSYTLSPMSYGIESVVSGNDISFSLTVPRKIILWKVNSLAEKLFIIADPLEDDAPQPSAVGIVNLDKYGADKTGVTDALPLLQMAVNESAIKQQILYIPSGTYKLNGTLDMKSNASVYLEGGVCLKRGARDLVRFNDGVSNAKLYGKGILDGDHKSGRMIYMHNASNITLDGIVLQRSSGDFHIYMIYASNVTITNIKLVGETGRAGNDGIDPDATQNVKINDVFVYSGDDCHSLGINQDIRRDQEYINMTNCVLWNNASGAGMKSFGFYGPYQVRYMTYENLDIIHAPSRLDPLAVGGGTVSQLWFKNIRIEDLATNRDGSPFYIGGVNYNPWGPKDPSSMSDLYFQNITITTFGGRTSYFEGRDSLHLLKNVTFDYLYIAGQKRMNIKDANFQIGNPFVQNLTFTDTDAPAVGVKIKSSVYVKAGQTVRFTVTRTGNSSLPVTVKYLMRGTAKDGADYSTPSGFITIPAGQKSVEIAIKTKSHKLDIDPKTIMIELQNQERSAAWMLGPDWWAVVVITR